MLGEAARSEPGTDPHVIRRAGPLDRRPALCTSDAEGLESLSIPSSRQIETWRDVLADQGHRRARHREQGRELASRWAEIEAAIDAAGTAGSIGDEEAGALRAARE